MCGCGSVFGVWKGCWGGGNVRGGGWCGEEWGEMWDNSESRQV